MGEQPLVCTAARQAQLSFCHGRLAAHARALGVFLLLLGRRGGMHEETGGPLAGCWCVCVGGDRGGRGKWRGELDRMGAPHWLPPGRVATEYHRVFTGSTMAQCSSVGVSASAPPPPAPRCPGLQGREPAHRPASTSLQIRLGYGLEIALIQRQR